MARAKVVTIPKMPNPQARTKKRNGDSRYVEGQRVLVGAMTYLARTDKRSNKDAINLLSEHFRTQFRMDDRP
jgi:hypothetical protein